jgi:hypothetical protein
VNVIFHAAHDDWLAVEMGQNAAEVTVQFFPQNFSKRLRHDANNG